MGINRKKVRNAAQKQVRKGNWTKAIREYEKLVDDDPSDVRSRMKLADLFTRTDQEEKALDSYRNAGDQHASQDFYQKAVAVYKQALRLQSDSPDLHRKVGDCYHRLDRLKDAAQAFRKAQQCYKESGEREKQIEVLEEIIRLDPDDVGLHIQLAENYAKESRRDDALETFRTAADMLQEEGRQDDFAQVAERILYFDPDDLPVRKQVIDIYLNRDDQKRALKHLQVCFNNNPEDVETLRKLAETFQRLDRTDKAVLVFQQLAKVYKKRDRIGSAKQVWKRILEFDPDNKAAKKRLREHGEGPKKRQKKQSRQPQQPASSRESGSMAAFEEEDGGGPSTLDDIEFLDEEPAETGPQTPGPQQSPPVGDQSSGGAVFGEETFGELGDLDLDKLDELPGSENEGTAQPADQSAGTLQELDPEPLDEPSDSGQDQPAPVDVSGSIEPVDPDEIPESAAQPVNPEFQEMVNEAEVFIKYGLLDNARDVIETLLDEDPDYLPAFELRRKLMAETGDTRSEATTLVRMARLTEDQPDRAQGYLQDALELGVADRHVWQIADELGVTLEEPADEPDPAPEPDPINDFEEVGGGLSEPTRADEQPVDEHPPPEQAEPAEPAGAESESEVVELDPDDDIMKIDPDSDAVVELDGDEGADDEEIMEIDPDAGGSGVMELDPDEVEIIDDDDFQESPGDTTPPDDFADTDVLSGGADPVADTSFVEDDDFDEAELEAVGEFSEGLDEQTDPDAGPADNPFGDTFQQEADEGDRMAQTDLDDSGFEFTDQEVEGALDGLFESFADDTEQEDPLSMGSDDPSGELAEIDNYIQQELYDEAIEALEAFEENNPGHPGIDKRYYQIKTARQGGKVERNPSGARSLSTQFEPMEPDEEVADNTPFDPTNDVMNTNLDLGVAYRDMGLVDEAIEEFRQALDDPDAAPEAKYQIALCKADKGQTGQAADELNQLLEDDVLPGDLQSEARDKLDELDAPPA